MIGWSNRRLGALALKLLSMATTATPYVISFWRIFTRNESAVGDSSGEHAKNGFSSSTPPSKFGSGLMGPASGMGVGVGMVQVWNPGSNVPLLNTCRSAPRLHSTW